MTKGTGFATIDTYHFILQWALEHKGNTPSQRQIAAGCGFSNATAHYHTNDLINKGLLERKDGELCVVRGTFAIPENAFEIEDLQRLYPPLAEMGHIPKDIMFAEFVEHPLDALNELGIILGDAVDSEFLAASYPSGWSFGEDLQKDSGVELRHLSDQKGNIIASARFNRRKYEASIYFWGK